MFDVVQISWWFLQVTLVGYLCNYRVFTNDVDRVLFAPICGLAALLIVANAVWMWSFPTYLTSFLLAASIGAAILFIWSKRPKFAAWDSGTFPVLAWLFGGMLLIAMHGSLIPFDQKVFQGNPVDRIGYIASYIQFQQEPLDYFVDALKRLNSVGDKRPLLLHPMYGAAMNEMKARTAAGLSFISLSWLTPRDLHQLANAWEVFLRAIQFQCVLALFTRFISNRFLAGFLALGISFGYWFQYMKDYNSWPHMVTLALAITIVALLTNILNNRRTTEGERRLIYLIAFAMIVNHPEFGLVMCAGIGVIVLWYRVLREQLLLRRASLLEGVVFVVALFVAHPYILPWLKRMFLFSATMGNETHLGQGIYKLFEFSEQAANLIAAIYQKPFWLFAPPILGDIVTGTTGFPYVAYFGSTVALGLAVLLIAGILAKPLISQTSIASPLVGRLRIFGTLFSLVAVGAGVLLIFVGMIWPTPLGSPVLNNAASIALGSVILCIIIYCAITTQTPTIRVVLVLVGFHFCFFSGSLILFRYFGILGPGSAYRSIPYWSIFAGIGLTLALATSPMQMFRLLAVTIGLLNLAFASSIFWVTNHGGMEAYASFYPFRDGHLFFQKASVRNSHSFDYLDIAEQLKRCNLVFLDFKDVEPRGIGRFQAANLMLFLDNNHIPVRLGFWYLGGYQLLGGEFHFGFKKDQVKPDCVVDQEMREGKLRYRLTQVDLP